MRGHITVAEIFLSMEKIYIVKLFSIVCVYI